MTSTKRCGFGNWFKCTIVLITLATFVLSDQLSEESSHCTADSCDTNGENVVSEDAEEERESGVHLAFVCSAPHVVPEEDVPVIMLHGLTDTSKTWDGIYQNIPVLTHRKACVYDARNHGDSGWNDTFSIDILAEDLEHFMNKMKFEKAVLVGHSMGGLTAMAFALSNPSRVDRLFVEDISPLSIPKHANTFVTAWLHLLHNSISFIPKGADETTAKKVVVDYLQQVAHTELPDSFRKHTPLRQRDGVWQWKMNSDVINVVLEKPEKFFSYPKGRYDGKTLFIYGKTSLFKVGDQKEDIRKFFPNSEFFGVEGAGHIIHSMHSEFVTKLIKFLE